VQPTDPGWVDLALLTPTMNGGRARRELGWAPTHDARDVLREALSGAAAAAGADTPPLRSR
jgi:UDP-glucose 4-epimerase